MYLNFTPLKKINLECRPSGLLFALFTLLSVCRPDHAMAQDLTIITSGETGTSGTNWSISGNVLTVASSGSASIHPSVIVNHLTNTGDLRVVLPWQSTQPRHCYINSNIAYTGSTARTLTFSIANNIQVASGVSITSSNSAMNLVLNGRNQIAAGPDYGRVVLDGVTINTNGGHLWAGGGTLTQTWNGLTVGADAATTWADDQAAISISGSTLSTAGGNLYFNGQSWESVDADGLNYGVHIIHSSISSQSGSIEINGDVRGTFTNGIGTRIESVSGNTSITSTSGAISITGTGADQGTNNNNWRYATFIYSASTTNRVTISTTSGPITVSGSASFTATINDKEGLVLGGDGLSVTSQSGNITLRGTNTLESSGQYTNSIRFSALNAANAVRIGFNGTNAYSGNILIEGNSIYQRTSHPGTGSIAIQSTGTLTIQPTGNSFTYTRAGDVGTLTYDDDWNFGTTLSGFTLGKSTNTMNLTIGNPLSVAGPITVYAGTITLNGNLTSTAAGDISLYSNEAIGGLSSARTITTTGAFKYIPRSASFTSAVTFPISNLTLTNVTGVEIGKSGNTSGVTIGGTASVNGYVNIYGGAITVSAALSAAGNILLNGDPGSFLTQDTRGVTVNAAVTTSNNGNITIIGRGGSGSGYSTNHGVYITQLIEAGGSGTVSVTGTGGLSNNGLSGSCHGVSMDGASAWVKSNGGNVTVTGYGGGANTGSYSQGVPLTSNARISAGGSGTVNITGTGGVNSVVGLRGVVVVSGSSIFSAGGAINITGYHGTNGSDNSDGFTLDNATIGSNTSGPITITGTGGGGTGSDAISLSSTNTIGGASYTGNIILQGNNLNVSGTNTLTTTGLVAIEPVSTSFATAQSFPIGNLTVTSNGLRLGKSGNTAALTITGAVATSGPVTTFSGNFTTNAGATLTATSSALTVNASGNLTLNAALAGSSTTVNVHGNLQTTGTLTNVTLEGGSAQSITGTATLTNLTVNKSAGTATISAGPQNLTGTLTLTAGTLAAGGNLKLKSTSTGTARVAEHATGTGNVTGNVVVERFIPGSRKMQWRMLAFPYNAPLTLSNISGIKINYTSPQTMMYFRENVDNGAYGNTGARNGGYESYTLNSQTIPVGRGVAAWVYGDESTSATPGAGTLGAGGITVSSLGGLNETGADVTINGLTNVVRGWNLVGNPFASTIDWHTVHASGTNLAATVYRWDPQAEAWTAYNTDLSFTGQGSRYIESGSAFFVKAFTEGNNTIGVTIPQSAKVTNAPNMHFTKNPLKLDIPGQRVGAASALAGLRLKASGMGNPIPGEAYLDVSKTDATKGWDPQYDGLMMARTSGASVYFDGEKDYDFSMHFDKPLMNGEQRYYPITVTTPMAGETLIEIAPEGNWSSMHSVALIDKQLGRTILMRDGQISYKLRLEELKSEGRFLLAINHVKLSADGQSPVFEAKALGNPVTGNVIDLLLTHPTASAKRWRVVDAMGREAGVGVFATDAGIQHRLTVPGMRSSGVYVLQVEMDNGETQQLRILKN